MSIENAIGLKSMEFYIPETLLPTKDLPEIQGLAPQAHQAFAMLQVESVSIDETADDVDLAVRAGKQAMEKAGLTPDEIDILIFLQSRAPGYLMSSEATRAQQELGLKRAYCFTLTDLGCANISNALLLAKTYMIANPSLKNILICCGSKPFGQYRYREAVTVIGDAGMGAVVSRTAENRIVDVKLRTDGKFWDLYKIDYKHMLSDEYRELCTSPRYKFELSIASRNNFTEMTKATLEENGLTAPAAYIMQNLAISAFAFNENAQQIKFAKCCYDNCRKFGHLGSIDILLNYKTGLESGEIKKGDHVLILNNSPVACWSTVLLEA